MVNKRTFQPNYYYDISNFLPFKIKAMKMYKTEIQKTHNLDLLKQLKFIKLRGSEINKKFAEAFFLYRKII